MGSEHIAGCDRFDKAKFGVKCGAKDGVLRKT